MLTEKEKKFIQAHRNDDVRELMLQGSKDPEIDLRRIAVQISGWQAASKKLPTWARTDGIVYPEHLSMEQCSSEATGRYKGRVMMRRLLAQNYNKEKDCPLAGPPFKFADLTGGFGVDTAMISEGLKETQTTFVERNPDLCELARHNLPLLGVRHLEVECGESEAVLERLPFQDAIFLDPARRDTHGRKTVAIEDCTPDLTRLNRQLLDKARVVMAKLSPMLHLSLAVRSLKGVEEVHVVGVNGECKELLLVMSAAAMEEGRRVSVSCVNMKGENLEEFHYFLDEEDSKPSEHAYTKEVGAYLYEPNACIMKAGCFKTLGAYYGLQMLGTNSHLYTSQDMTTDGFPGRIFEVQTVLPFNKNNAKRLHNTIDQANITARNFPLSVAELRKRLKIKEGGNNYIFATTLPDSSLVLILCTKPTF